jgi:hypothetical protein
MLIWLFTMLKPVGVIHSACLFQLYARNPAERLSMQTKECCDPPMGAATGS